MHRNSYREYIGFNDHLMILFGIPLVGIILPLVFFDQKLELQDPQFWINWGVSCVYTSIYWLGNRFIIVQMRKRWPDLTQIRKRLLWQFVLVNVYTFSFCNVIDQAFQAIVNARDFTPETMEVNVASFTDRTSQQ